MQILLDTHAFIWFINGEEMLSDKSKKLIENAENKCFLSIASLWEIAIKTSLGKLQLRTQFDAIADFLAVNDIEILPLTFPQIQQLLKLEFHHRDPFDRIIIAQGITENLTILTRDEHFKKYVVAIDW